jgi:hypothetical protein
MCRVSLGGDKQLLGACPKAVDPNPAASCVCVCGCGCVYDQMSKNNPDSKRAVYQQDPDWIIVHINFVIFGVCCKDPNLG